MTATGLVRIAALFGTEISGLVLVRGGNHHGAFEYQAGGMPRLLRLSPADEDRATLDAAMLRLSRLRDLGAPVVRPVLSRRGRLCEVVAFEGRAAVATAFEREPGTSFVRLSESSLDQSDYAEIGRSLARLHAASDQLSGCDAEIPPWFEQESCFCTSAPARPVGTAILDMYRKSFGICKSFGEGGPGWGVIHGDLHFDNLIFDRAAGRVVFCDFDDCCRGWRAMDLALLVFDLGVILDCVDRSAGVAARRDLIIAGYREGGVLAEAEASMLPHFMKLLEVSLYLQYGGHPERSDPESWLGRFLTEREERILTDAPYL